jgi:hypothetical protein
MNKKYRRAVDIRNALAQFNIEHGTCFILKDLYGSVLKTQKQTYVDGVPTVRGVSRSYISWGLRSKSNLLDLQLDEAFSHLETLI